MPMEKRPVKAVIMSALLPAALEGLTPAARDFQAATHIRSLSFGDVATPELVFEEIPVEKSLAEEKRSVAIQTGKKRQDPKFLF